MTFLLLGLALEGCAPVSGSPDIVGTWQAEEKGTHFQFLFREDGTCEWLIQEGDQAPNKFTGDYWLDASKRPVPLTIRNIPQLPHPLHTVVEFKGPDVMRLGSFAPRWRLRPVTFPAGEALILTRARLSGGGDH